MKATSSTCIASLGEWCKEYHNTNNYPVNLLERFAIGIYQISQGEKWNDNKLTYREYESFASAAIHFICCLEYIKFPHWYLVPIYLKDYVGLDTKPIDYRTLMLEISAAQQQIFYYHKSYIQGYHRASRFNAEKLAKHLHNCVLILLGSIPSYERSKAIEQATSIMMGRL